MKKLIALLLCAIMILPVFAGCGEGSTDETKGGSNNGDGPITVEIGIPQRALVTDYYNNDYTKWLEEQTGYRIEWELFAANSGDYSSQLATMTAGGLELPDMLIGFELGDSVYKKYGDEGYFIDLAPYYNDPAMSATFWDSFEKLDEEYQEVLMRRLVDENGHMYAFPSIEESLIDTMAYQVWINDKWLANVGMEKPTSTEELMEVLKAFRDQDANGNGNPNDELPLMGTQTTMCGDIFAWIVNMFTYYDSANGFSVDDNGQLYHGLTTEGYREALKFLYDLVVTEKVMNPMALTISSNDLQPMVTPAEGEPIAGIVVCHPTLGFTQGDPGILQYSCLPLWGSAVRNEQKNHRRGFITENAENPEACWAIWMAMCSEEGSIRSRYGNRGEHWDWPDEGAESFLGIPAQYKLYEDVWATQGDDNFRIVESTILLTAEQEGAQLRGDEDEVTLHKYKMFTDMRESFAKQEEALTPDEKYLCPTLIWNELEKEECPERNDCSSYMSKARSEFATGVRNPYNDNDWNQYLKDLEDLGMAKWTQYAQGIYERTIAEEE